MKKINLYLLIGVFSVLLWSCHDESKDGTTDEIPTNEVDEQDDKMKGMHGLPSPIQIASTIKNAGVNYDASVLNPISNSSRYTNNFKKSLNVGIYGADLGYAALYGQTQDAIDYLSTVKELADELGIIGAFERNTIDEVEANLGNQDKLLEIVTDAFFKSDQYLQQHKRNKASALILAGGWIEGLHIATQMINNSASEEVKIRVGEQKISFEILMALLSQFEDSEDSEVKQLLSNIAALKEVFDQIEITYENRGVKTDDVEGHKTTIETTSTVNITDEMIKSIEEKVGFIRNQIIS